MLPSTVSATFYIFIESTHSSPFLLTPSSLPTTAEIVSSLVDLTWILPQCSSSQRDLSEANSIKLSSCFNPSAASQYQSGLNSKTLIWLDIILHQRLPDDLFNNLSTKSLTQTTLSCSCLSGHISFSRWITALGISCLCHPLPFL